MQTHVLKHLNPDGSEVATSAGDQVIITHLGTVWLGENVVFMNRVTVGKNVRIGSGSILGRGVVVDSGHIITPGSVNL